METILRRERILVGACLTVLVLLSWAYLMDMARDMQRMPMSMPMPAGAVMGWTPADLILLFVMWAVMMVAMMVPSAAPMALAFLSVNDRRRDTARPVVSTSIFILGYVAVWTAYSAVATLAQWGLHEAAPLDRTT